MATLISPHPKRLAGLAARRQEIERAINVLGLNVAITSQLGDDPRSVLLDETDFVGETYRSARLDLGSAAVNEQLDTCDETGVIRPQKQRHLSNFLGFPHASHRDGGHNPRNHVCRLPKAAVPLTLATEPLRMIEPPSFSSGKAFCTVNSVPLT